MDLYDENQLRAEIPLVVARANATLHRDDPRRTTVEELEAESTASLRPRMRRVISDSYEQLDLEHARLRSSRSILLTAASSFGDRAHRHHAGRRQLASWAPPLCFPNEVIDARTNVTTVNGLNCPTGAALTAPQASTFWLWRCSGRCGGAPRRHAVHPHPKGTSTPYDVPVAFGHPEGSTGALGTAVLHGATTAIFAMVSKTLMHRWSNRQVLALLPGLALAVVIHSAFNHVPLPLAMTFLIMLLLPVAIIIVPSAAKRPRALGRAGLDLDVELLELVRSEHFAYTRFGTYLQELRHRFNGLVVADMFCLLRLELELSVQAKAMLLAREAGLIIPVTPDLQISLEEIQYLQSSIGRTGLLALKPLQVTSDRDRWHRYLLTEAGQAKGR